MKPPISYILPLLFLLLSFSHRSFALDDNQDSTSYEAHLLNVEEYCQFLIAVASAEDLHGLYDPKAMSGEIFQTASPEDQQPNFLYSIAHQVDQQIAMLGLTELDAMRCCNWIETSLPSSDNTPTSTEIGSYILHEDGSFEVNNTAQLHLIHHDDGTFEIISSVKKTNSPLMMPGGPERYASKGKNKVGRFPDAGSETAAKRRQYDRADGQDGSSSQQNPSAPAMNITVSSLAHILHNDNFDDASLIRFYAKSDRPTHNGEFVTIKDKLWCLPELIKACFRSQEDRKMMADTRLKIRTDLEDFMMKSSTYKEQALAGLSRTKITSGRTDKTKITDNLDEFDQYFINHTLTRGNLKQFCHTHYITVPEPATGRIAKISECTVPINYGSINNVINQRKLLTGFPCAPRQTTVFNTNHVEEIHTLIMTTRN